MVRVLEATICNLRKFFQHFNDNLLLTILKLLDIGLTLYQIWYKNCAICWNILATISHYMMMIRVTKSKAVEIDYHAHYLFYIFFRLES